jgi:2-oxoglutarate dehydrogenase E1 component
LRNIVHAESFEEELHKKYVGSKRFSLQGAETMIPMLLSLLESAAEMEIQGAVFGMAHRGRLNVLVNVFGKSLEQVFTEFEDTSLAATVGAGDVKYHLGYESLFRTTRGRDIRLSLAPNPSHLEFVNPVVEGMVRAMQDRAHGGDRKSILPVLLHGDAAFAGQGVVFETLNFSRVKGYNTGGTVHLVINNQVGFTTDPVESRSSTYCTDMAKAVQAPIFHVNCEDVEGACWVMRNALEFRNEFNRDVVIDLYCYRKYGHNEGDDPSFTQPVIYSEIREKTRISDVYAADLVAEGTAEPKLIDRLRSEYHELFAGAQERKSISTPIGEACAVHGRLRLASPETGVSGEILEKVAQQLITHPEWFVPHEKLQKILEKRVQTLTDDSGIEWGFAEALAYGSLMLDGINIRLSGQDCGRGTFSQRHLELTHNETGKRYFPLSKLSAQDGVGTFEVYNSTLSEAAVLGFEFGFASTAKQDLVLWEAQFGDFVNGAQVIIDQFLAASEAKWNQRSGVVLLLPHGYEGQGPEHSSARLERFLQLCAEGNMLVCNPSCAEQYFHLLRRQALEKIKRPLVVMTPKSLLRLPAANATRAELEQGCFDLTIADDVFPPEDIKYMFFMSGKVYHDVKRALSETQFANYELVRLEQLYPFPAQEIATRLNRCNGASLFWVQEEPQNMGAWNFVDPLFTERFQGQLAYIGRPASASTAAGSNRRHGVEQESILETVVAICSGA